MQGGISVCCLLFFFFQAEDGIRDLVRSRGLGDVYKRQGRTLRGFPDVKKLRVQNSDVTKGKSGGYRLIYLVDLSLIHI